MSQPGETSETGSGNTAAEKLKEHFLMTETAEKKFIESMIRKIEEWILDMSNWREDSNKLKCFYRISAAFEVPSHRNGVKVKIMNALEDLSKKHGITLVAPCVDSEKVWFRKTRDGGWTEDVSVCEFAFE